MSEAGEVDPDRALLLLDMGDRVELAARELLAALDELGPRWQPIVLGPSMQRLRRALDAAEGRRMRERFEASR